MERDSTKGRQLLWKVVWERCSAAGLETGCNWEQLLGEVLPGISLQYFMQEKPLYLAQLLSAWFFAAPCAALNCGEVTFPRAEVARQHTDSFSWGSAPSPGAYGERQCDARNSRLPRKSML